MTGRAPRFIFMLIALVLLTAFWMTVWRSTDQSVMSRVPILDEAVYLQSAATIVEENWAPAEPFTMSPLYSYLVAVTGSGRDLDEHRILLGGPPWGIRILQVLLWLGTAWFMWRVGRELFGPRWAYVAPILWVGYAPAAILTSQVLMEIPLVFVATLALAIGGGYVGPRSLRNRALLCGALVGAAFLFRGTAAVLLVPVVFALMPDRSFVSFRNAIWPVAAAMLIVILPFTIFNSMRAGRMAPPAMNGGVNLYIGNAPGATGFFEPIAGFDAENDPSGAEYLSQKYGKPITEPWAANQEWLHDGRQAIQDDPARAIGLWLRKVRLHFVAIEIPQISAVSTWQRQAPLLRVLVVPWALFAAAGLVGGILSWRRYPRLAPWLIAVVLLVAAQSLFFVVTRYRIILVPTLALASVALLRELTKRQWRDFLLLAIAVLLVWPWGLDGVRRNFKVGALENEAIRWEHTAKAAEPAAADLDLAEAEVLYRESIAIADHRVDSWQGLGRVLWLRNEQTAAITTLTEGIEKVKVKQGLRDDLIAMLVRQGRLSEALPHLELALIDAPENADHLHNAAVASSEAGQSIEAATFAQNLIVAHPTDARGYFDLGVLYARAGLLTEARDIFAAGLRQVPNHPELTRNLARVEESLATQEEK